VPKYFMNEIIMQIFPPSIRNFILFGECPSVEQFKGWVEKAIILQIWGPLMESKVSRKTKQHNL
jgi:hypothetical protein